MNFSKLFLMLALGVALNNGACGMKDDDKKRKHNEIGLDVQQNKNKQKKVYDDKASQELLIESDKVDSDLDKIKGLLERNANPNIKIKKSYGMMFLQHAAETSHFYNPDNGIGVTICTQIVKLGCKFLYVYFKGQKIYDSTPLHRAVLRGNPGCVQLLVAHGADVTVQDKKGLAPLHTAVLNKREECVEIIINHIKNIASVKSLDNFASLCLIDTTFKEQVRIFLLINNRKKALGLKIPKFLCFEIISLFIDPSLFLRKLINDKDKNGRTSLSIARAQGYYNIVRLLEPYENKETKASISHSILN